MKKEADDGLRELVETIKTKNELSWFYIIGKFALEFRYYEEAIILFDHYLSSDKEVNRENVKWQRSRAIALKQGEKDPMPMKLNLVGDYDELMEYYFDYKKK